MSYMEKKQKMNCRQVHNHLIAYMEGSLPGKTEEAVGEHLTHCASCSAVYTRAGRTMKALAETLPTIDPGVFYYTRLKQRMENELHPVIPAIRLQQHIPILQTMLFSLFIFAGIIGGIMIGSGTSSTSPGVSFTSAQTPQSFAYNYYMNEMDHEIIEQSILKEK